MDSLNEHEINKKTIADLQAQISRYELSEQKMRSIQHKLDTQIETFNMIHKYTQQAFRAVNTDILCDIIAEGIADVFQLEISAVFTMNPDRDNLTLSGSFNIDKPGLVLPISDEWLQNKGLKDQIEHDIITESPVGDDSLFSALGVSHILYVPIIGNERTCEGIILGGVSKSGDAIYDFRPNELLYPFMVYSQQMNGIFNGLSAMARANEAARAKTVFLANLSHEMRTPLNAIIGMAQVSRKSGYRNDRSKEISQIETSSKHLLSLINDILEISKIEEGKLVLAKEAFLLSEIIDNLLVSSRQQAEDKHQELVVKTASLKSDRFIGDSIRLSQVLLNLLSNAIKFTPEHGRIDFEIKELSSDPENAMIEFSVKDTGIGILPEFMPNLFSPFEQADSSISRKYGGTGLGLAISQRIANQMDSEIIVESEPGEGTQFNFSVILPKDNTVATTIVRKTYEIPKLSGKRALVVDDVEINREIIFFLLEQTGISIENAQNGKIALDMVEESEEGYYDLILMDIQMPLMDGYTATKMIRALERADTKETVILAMTANAFKEDIEQALEAGMNGHLSKPVEESVLLKAIAEALKI